MPGLCGIISKLPAGKNIQELEMMVHTMMHEPFYSSGTYSNEQLGLYVGWVAHKDSFAECMPVFNEKHNLLLFFAGEDFPDEDSLTMLRARGHRFNSANAEYLIHLYEEARGNFLEEMNGNFHGLLVDLMNKQIVLFNDRYGMLRIYIHEGKNEFIFSAEAKSLLKIRPELRAIHPKSMGELLSCNCVLENRTLFPLITLLPGGSRWSFRENETVRKESYFKPAQWESQPVLAPGTFFQNLKDTFSTIIPKYFKPINHIALSLTGGLDTRMILAGINCSELKFNCYTHSGPYHDSYDLKIARQVAKVCQQVHYTLKLDEDFITHFPDLAAKSVYISDGNLDLSGAANLYMNRLARKVGRIRITGNHGSELFRSVGWIKPLDAGNALFHPDFKHYIRESKETFYHQKAGHPLTFSHFKEAPWHEYNRLAVEQSQLVQRSPFMDIALVKLMYQAPPNLRCSNKISLRLIEAGNPTLSAIKTERGVGGKSTRFSSLGARAYYEFLFKMDYYFNHGMPQWLSRANYCLGFLSPEKLFLGRHKYYHYRVWYRDKWADYIREILLDECTLNRPYFSRDSITSLVRDHIKGIRNFTAEIDLLLKTELMHRLLIEQ